MLGGLYGLLCIEMDVKWCVFESFWGSLCFSGRLRLRRKPQALRGSPNQNVAGSAYYVSSAESPPERAMEYALRGHPSAVFPSAGFLHRAHKPHTEATSLRIMHRQDCARETIRSRTSKGGQRLCGAGSPDDCWAAVDWLADLRACCRVIAPRARP